MAASLMGSSQRLAALAFCLILLLDITMPSLVLANKAKGGGRAQKRGGHKGGKGGGPKGGGVAPNVPKPNPVIPPNPIPAAGSAPAGGGVPVPEAGKGIIYHGGPLLTGDINLSIIFYGQFTAEQKNVVRSFLRSLENTENDHIAAVHRWWDIVEAYQLFTNKPGLNPTATPPRLRIKVGTQQTDDKYTVGKVLTIDFINSLFKKADSGKPNTLVVLFTGSQVTVTGLCRGKCYEHGLVDNKPYLIVGNPEIECPGACAWPFNRLDYGVPTQATVKPPTETPALMPCSSTSPPAWLLQSPTPSIPDSSNPDPRTTPSRPAPPAITSSEVAQSLARPESLSSTPLRVDPTMPLERRV
ncbi:protein EXORDIUM-like 4 [Prunus yedoensis var. nudiflora]|uniref:Protein EXORDIUM-like 4 n=1 Tax=Prunus yedoensis var. nudiflora TaxID=2094558 RepID=A0A314UUL7_PRUYE|nr:protein EXORDIUM-like 4 [Prunus yedoensis var. nudiflora]